PLHDALPISFLSPHAQGPASYSGLGPCAPNCFSERQPTLTRQTRSGVAAFHAEAAGLSFHFFLSKQPCGAAAFLSFQSPPPILGYRLGLIHPMAGVNHSWRRVAIRCFLRLRALPATDSPRRPPPAPAP